MSEDNPIRVFVTHTFHESDDYLRVFEFLESTERFFYINVSKPEKLPPGGMEAIKHELIEQITACEAVIVLASTYLQKPDFVRFQMHVAAAKEKPVIVIRPFGGMRETPDELIDKAAEHLDWNNREICDALRRQARLEDTTRWDVIDFP